MKEPPNHRGRGRFLLLDIVQWCAGRGKKTHTGIIMEVVKYGMYPTVCRNEHIILKVRKLIKEDIDWPELISSAYYREHESYVVEDASGKRWWPRVGHLTLIKRSGKEDE